MAGAIRARARRTPERRGGRLKALFKLVFILFILCAVAVFCVERRDLPAGMRNHDAILAAYDARDTAVRTVKRQIQRLSPASKDKKRTSLQEMIEQKSMQGQGYTNQERQELDSLLREGE